MDEREEERRIVDAMPDEIQKISMIVAEVREVKQSQAMMLSRQNTMEVLLNETVRQQTQTGQLLATLVEQSRQHGSEIEKTNIEIKEIKVRDVNVGNLLASQAERIRGLWLVMSGAGTVILLIVAAVIGHYVK